MPVVKIINQGWARSDNEVWQAVPTTSLILSGKKKILVDPGNDPKLPDILEIKSIWPEEIDTIFLTHDHIDHIKHIGLFPDSDIIDPTHINCGIKSFPHGGIIPDTEIKIIPTPGHTLNHGSLLIPTQVGKILVCGDLFWWKGENKEAFERKELVELEDDLAWDRNELKRSREKVLDLNVVRYIPGHGRPFKLIG
jgi:glyoxylase-like metal-dependent hydrolase (beta-lactamase superfamily II)